MNRAASRPPPSPHDLLIAPPGAVAFECDPPAWAHKSLARLPVVVVRRAEYADGNVPVGVRGSHRAERIAATLPLSAIAGCTRPEDLVARRAWLTAPRTGILPHFDALEALRGLLEPLAVAWGPTGGMGYELATKWPCLTAQSDVDIVLRAPAPMARSEARALIAAFAALRVPIDAQLDTGCGAVALVEFASARDRLLMRTRHGPRLVFDPWLPRE
jgi:phosphoribosyl-dephospho-CoA transferase